MKNDFRKSYVEPCKVQFTRIDSRTKRKNVFEIETLNERGIFTHRIMEDTDSRKSNNRIPVNRSFVLTVCGISHLLFTKKYFYQICCTEIRTMQKTKKKKRINSVNQIFRNPRKIKDKKLRLTEYYEKSYLQIKDKRKVWNETRSYFPTELLLAIQLVVENKVNCAKINEFYDVSILPSSYSCRDSNFRDKNHRIIVTRWIRKFKYIKSYIYRTRFTPYRSRLNLF